MITLITGTPGAGKTLYAVTKMLDEIAAKAERPVYSDIIGLNVDGILPSPDDWRDAQKGALIIYDEVQFRQAYQRARGKTRYDYILQLTTHRHDGYDVWLISQSAKFLHLDVLELVGRHLHLDRPYGAALANVYEWESATLNPKGRDAKQSVRSKTLFKYNKSIFEYYSSVDVDDKTANHKKFKLPFSQYKWLLVGFAVIGWGVWNFTSKSSDKPQTVAPLTAEAETTAPPPPVAPLTAEAETTAPPPLVAPPPAPPVAKDKIVFDPLTSKYMDINLAPANVVAFADSCNLYNHAGQLLLNYDHSTCLTYLDNTSLLARTL